MLNIKSVALLSLALVFAVPAKSDPLSDALGGLFNGEAVAAQTYVKSHKGRTNLSTLSSASTGGKTVWASYYGHGEKLNSHTASGERFNPHALTAAHRTLPMGSKLLVSLRGKSIVVTINDRGPAAWTGKSLDLTYGAARALGMRDNEHVNIARIR